MTDRNRDTLTRKASDAGVQITEDGGLAVADPERLMELMARKTFANVAARIGPLLDACGVRCEVTSDADGRTLVIGLENRVVTMDRQGKVYVTPRGPAPEA